MGAFFIVCTLCANILTSGQDVANWRMILAGVLAIVMLVLGVIQSLRLARAFGKSVGFGVCLIFGPLARLILGFGRARYVGHPDR